MGWPGPMLTPATCAELSHLTRNQNHMYEARARSPPSTPIPRPMGVLMCPCFAGGRCGVAEERRDRVSCGRSRPPDHWPFPCEEQSSPILLSPSLNGWAGPAHTPPPDPHTWNRVGTRRWRLLFSWAATSARKRQEHPFPTAPGPGCYFSTSSGPDPDLPLLWLPEHQTVPG